VIWGKPVRHNQDVGCPCGVRYRPTHPGYECWASNGDSTRARSTHQQHPAAVTNSGFGGMPIPLRELLDSNQIGQMELDDNQQHRWLTASRCILERTAPNPPLLSGDIFGRLARRGGVGDFGQTRAAHLHAHDPATAARSRGCTQRRALPSCAAWACCQMLGDGARLRVSDTSRFFCSS